MADGVQSKFESNATTYPSSWQAENTPLPMPGTVTAAPSPEHKNAKEQEYYLQDSAQPVKKGTHERTRLDAPEE